MERRVFIKNIAIASGALALVGTGGLIAAEHHLSSRNNASRILTYENLEQAVQEIENLKKSFQNLQIQGSWNLYQHLTHCQQSIQFSMQGFPENKAAIFQKFIGKRVFQKFSEQGYMRHDRNEAIPKAPELIENGNIEQAFEDLISTITAFENHDQKLFPHFAYGELSKKQYAQAHAMHLADHFAIMKY